MAQGNLLQPTEFNLLLLYDSPFGSVGGVKLPVVVEQFNNLSLATVETEFASGSALLSVLTFEQQPNPALSAYDLMNIDPSTAVPSITLTGLLDGDSTTWTAAPDLLAAGPTDTEFVVEVESNGAATLRFGDNTNGESPASNTAFTAAYRIGNGTAGNVGAESVTYFAGDPRILSCTNPLPAFGGVDPETNAQIQRRAPQAFLTQERAVTMSDYAVAAEANPAISSAAATLRWTGSWYTVFVAAKPSTGGQLSKALRKTLTKYVNAYRLAGQDVKLEGPDYVSLVIALTVCVDPEYFQADVQQTLLHVLGSSPQPNGQPDTLRRTLSNSGKMSISAPSTPRCARLPACNRWWLRRFNRKACRRRVPTFKPARFHRPLSSGATCQRPQPARQRQLTLNLQGGK